jgi:hypothetical protein
MADSFPTTEPAGPTTPEAFIADRQHFWGLFTRAIVTIVVAVVIVLLLMMYFLL